MVNQEVFCLLCKGFLDAPAGSELHTVQFCGGGGSCKVSSVVYFLGGQGFGLYRRTAQILVAKKKMRGNLWEEAEVALVTIE